MSNADFSIGTVVKLKSGSPQMTVYGLIVNNKVPCRWYDEELKEFKTFNFEKETIEIVKANNP